MSLLGVELIASLGGFEVGFKSVGGGGRRHRAVDGGGAVAAARAGAVADHLGDGVGCDGADRSRY